MNHLGAALPLSFGLTGNGAYHRFVKIHMLDLDVRHLDAPFVSLGIQNLLDIRVELVPFGEHFVQVVLAEHRAQCGLCQLTGRLGKILDLNDRPLRIYHAIVENGVDPHGHVVLGYDVLGGNIQRNHPKIYPYHLLDSGKNEDQAGALDALEATEKEHDPALVLREDADGRCQNGKQYDEWG